MQKMSMIIRSTVTVTSPTVFKKYANSNSYLINTKGLPLWILVSCLGRKPLYNSNISLNNAHVVSIFRFQTS